MSLIPIGDSVIVEIISNRELEHKDLQDKAKSSGILIPESKDSATNVYGAPVIGKVYAMSKDAKKEIGDIIKIGDMVAYSEPNPHGFEHDGKKLLRLKVEQIHARIS